MSLLEQDYQEGAGVRECYEIYEIYEEGIRKYGTDGRYLTPYPDQSLL